MGVNFFGRIRGYEVSPGPGSSFSFLLSPTENKPDQVKIILTKSSEQSEHWPNLSPEAINSFRFNCVGVAHNTKHLKKALFIQQQTQN